jgi:hypothetical protein
VLLGGVHPRTDAAQKLRDPVGPCVAVTLHNPISFAITAAVDLIAFAFAFAFQDSFVISVSISADPS